MDCQGSPEGLKKWQSDEYNHNNILDRLTPRKRLEYFDRLLAERERFLLERYGGFSLAANGSPKRLLSVGCGPHPRRGLPDGECFLVGVDSSPAMVAAAKASGTADEVYLGTATNLPFDDASFDVILFRLVLHHVVSQGPLAPVVEETIRVLRPGGVVIIVEPNVFHPIGMLLALSNRLGLSKRIKGTIDDCPLSPLRMRRMLRRQGFTVKIYGVEYAWRRLPTTLQRLLGNASFCGVLPVLRCLAHTFMIIGKKPT